MLRNEISSTTETTLSRLLTAQDVAGALSIGKSTVYQLIKRGELHCIRIGSSVRVRYEDLEKFIESNVQRQATNEHK